VVKVPRQLWLRPSSVPRVPGLPVKDYTRGCTNRGQSRQMMSAIDLTTKMLFERLYLVPGMGTFGPWINCPYAPTTPTVHVHIAERVLYPDCSRKGFCCASSTFRPIGFGLPSINQAQGEYTRNITEHDSLAKSVDSDFRVTGSHRQPIRNDTIHMRCSHHTHWVHASLWRRFTRTQSSREFLK